MKNCAEIKNQTSNKPGGATAVSLTGKPMALFPAPQVFARRRGTGRYHSAAMILPTFFGDLCKPMLAE